MLPFGAVQVGQIKTSKWAKLEHRTQLPLILKRTGKAEVKITPPNPAVSKELEGDWEGALPGGGEKVSFHFKNRPDQTVEATMESPRLRGTPQPFARVMQSGAQVEFALFIFGGSYKGTINNEGTAIAGAWTQGAVRRRFRLTCANGGVPSPVRVFPKSSGHRTRS